MAEAQPPTDTEVKLARGIMALLRAHEEGGDPKTWHLNEADWGDGRTTLEVRNRWFLGTGDDGQVRYTSGLVCQFRPDDEDGTRQYAQACIDAAASAVELAREIIARNMTAAPRLD